MRLSQMRAASVPKRVDDDIDSRHAADGGRSRQEPDDFPERMAPLLSVEVKMAQMSAVRDRRGPKRIRRLIRPTNDEEMQRSLPA